VVQQRDRATGDVYLILNGSNRFIEGYLIKTVALKSLDLQESLPPLDELQKFNAAAQVGGCVGVCGSRQGCVVATDAS
jgi:transcription elongation factor